MKELWMYSKCQAISRKTSYHWKQNVDLQEIRETILGSFLNSLKRDTYNFTSWKTQSPHFRARQWRQKQVLQSGFNEPQEHKYLTLSDWNKWVIVPTFIEQEINWDPNPLKLSFRMTNLSALTWWSVTKVQSHLSEKKIQHEFWKNVMWNGISYLGQKSSKNKKVISSLYDRKLVLRWPKFQNFYPRLLGTSFKM